MENHISGVGKIDPFLDDGTIEHILPENPDGRWIPSFVKDIQNNFIYRIGNYTLLEKKINNNCGGKVIHEKKALYQSSKYTLSNEFNFDSWNPTKLKSRQSKLVKYAKQIWRLPY